MDTWLQRISQISQFGLFLVTIVTIYFTVIPLYQKSLLDEKIAQKEIKLGHLKKELNAYYIKTRNSTVRDFTRNAAIKCSGALIELPATLFEAANQPSSDIDTVLSIQPEECLSETMETIDLSNLKPKDLALFKAEVARTGKILEPLRKAALRKYNAAVKDVEAIRDQLSDNSLTGAFAELSLTILPPEDIREINVSREVNKKQFNAQQRYADEVQTQTFKLKNISWPPIGIVDN